MNWECYLYWYSYGCSKLKKNKRFLLIQVSFWSLWLKKSWILLRIRILTEWKANMIQNATLRLREFTWTRGNQILLEFICKNKNHPKNYSLRLKRFISVCVKIFIPKRISSFTSWLLICTKLFLKARKSIIHCRNMMLRSPYKHSFPAPWNSTRFWVKKN